MVTKKNLTDIVRKLVSHLEIVEGQSYRDEVVSKIIYICSQEKYKVWLAAELLLPDMLAVHHQL